MEIVFDPKKDLKDELEVQVRLVIYDMKNSKFLYKQTISSREIFTVFVDTDKYSDNLKYKYQKKVDEKWVDIKPYKIVLPEKIHSTGLKYVLYEDHNSDKLVVIFQAISKTQSYNYIKTLKDYNINKLYIKDEYGEDH